MDTVTSADGTTLAYERTGHGPAVVMVSGAMCDRHANDALSALLAEHFTVYNYDRRGRGESDDRGSIADSMETAFHNERDDLAAVVEAAGGRAHLFGSSSGAILAWRAAASGVPATSVVLWEPPFGTTEQDSRHHLEYYEEIRTMIAEGRGGDAAARFLRRVGTPEEAITGMRNEPWWPGMAKVGLTLHYDASALNDGLLHPEEFTGLAAPVLLLEGGEAFEVIHRAAARVAEAVPGVRHEVIKGQTHDFEAGALAPTIVEFLRSFA